MRNALYLLFPLCNIGLGVLYGLTDGPFVDMEGRVNSARELVSSGSDDWFIITVALLSFIVSAVVAAVSLRKPVRQTALAWTYIGNYAIYLVLLALVQIDTSLVESILIGDWPLALALAFPMVGLIVVMARLLDARRRKI